MPEVITGREEFIKDNLGLVHSICKRFAGRGIEYDDLYQAGCIGLIKAVDAFDKSRGFAFSTYAVPVIMGEVRRLFRDGGSVKVSRNIKELNLKISRANEKFLQNENREPTIAELSKVLKVSVEEINEAICASQTTVSLTFENNDKISEFDLPVEDNREEIFNRILLQNAFSQLDEKERVILKYRYYDLLTQSSTANILNMTQVQVSRAEKRILLKLRHIIGNV